MLPQNSGLPSTFLRNIFVADCTALAGEKNGVICRDNRIIAFEGSGGTQQMIKKIKKKNKSPNGVLIKFPKKRQDLRIDLPTIGLETLKQCKMAGLKGVVLKHNLNIFLNKRQSVKYANRNKMFILVKWEKY